MVTWLRRVTFPAEVTRGEGRETFDIGRLVRVPHARQTDIGNSNFRAVCSEVSGPGAPALLRPPGRTRAFVVTVRRSRLLPSVQIILSKIALVSSLDVSPKNVSRCEINLTAWSRIECPLCSDCDREGVGCRRSTDVLPGATSGRPFIGVLWPNQEEKAFR